MSAVWLEGLSESSAVLVACEACCGAGCAAENGATCQPLRASRVAVGQSRPAASIDMMVRGINRFKKTSLGWINPLWVIACVFG